MGSRAHNSGLFGERLPFLRILGSSLGLAVLLVAPGASSFDPLSTALQPREDQDAVESIASVEGRQDDEAFEQLVAASERPAFERDAQARRRLAAALLPFLGGREHDRAMTLLLELARARPDASSANAPPTPESEWAAQRFAQEAALRVLCLTGDRRAALMLFGWAKTGADQETRSLARGALLGCPRGDQLLAHLEELLPDASHALRYLLVEGASPTLSDVTSRQPGAAPSSWEEAVNRVGRILACRQSVRAEGRSRCGDLAKDWTQPKAWDAAYDRFPATTRLTGAALFTVLPVRVQRRVEAWLTVQPETKGSSAPTATSEAPLDASTTLLRRASELHAELGWHRWSADDLWSLQAQLAPESQHLVVAPLCQRMHLDQGPLPTLERWLMAGDVMTRAACMRGLGAHPSPRAVGLLLAQLEREADASLRRVLATALRAWLPRLRRGEFPAFASAAAGLERHIDSLALLDPDPGVRAIASGSPEFFRRTDFVRYEAQEKWVVDASGRALAQHSLSAHWSTYRRPESVAASLPSQR